MQSLKRVHIARKIRITKIKGAGPRRIVHTQKIIFEKEGIG